MISCLTKDVKGLTNHTGKSSRYPNKNIRVKYINNIDNNIVHKDKIIIQREVTSINEGDNKSNENNKSHVSALEKDVTNNRKITLGHTNLIRNVINEDLNDKHNEIKTSDTKDSVQ